MKITAIISLTMIIFLCNSIIAALNVPIDVSNWSNVTRADELVSGGIPLPRGAVTDLNALKITDASGNTVPAQFRALTKWWRDKHENGKSNPSISWVQCNFLSTVAVKQNTRYFLKDGGGNSVPATPLQVTDADTTVTVVTGPLKFVLSRNSFTLFKSLWFDANNNRTYESSEQLIKQSVDNGGVISAGDWALGGCTPGTKHFSGTKPVDRIVVEESGPLKTVLRVEGRHYAKTGGVTKGLLGFQVFITAYAGSPYLDVQWAVTNIMLEGDRPPNAGGSTYTYTVHPFESYDLMLNFNLEQNLSWKLLGESEVTGTGTGRLFQNGETFSITSGTNGKDALGAAALTDGKITIMTAMRDFAVNQPKAIAVSGSQLIYELFPKNASGNPYALDPASRKNSRFCLTFKAGGAQQGDLAELTQKVNAPLRIFAPQEWYQATGAWTRGFGIPAGSAWYRQQPSAWMRLNKSSSNTYRHWQTGQTVKTSWEFDGMQEEFNGGGDHWGLTSPFYSAVMLGSPAEFEAAERSTFYFNDIVPVHNSWYDDPWKTYDFYLNVESTTPIRNLSVVHRISTNTNAYPGWTWRRSNTPDDGHMSHHELLEYYKLTGDYATLDAVKSFGINALLSVIGMIYASADATWPYRDHGGAPATLDSVWYHPYKARYMSRPGIVCGHAYEVTGDERFLRGEKLAAYSMRNGVRKHPIGYLSQPSTSTFSVFASGSDMVKYWKETHPEDTVAPAYYNQTDMFAGIANEGFYLLWQHTGDEAMREALIFASKSLEWRGGLSLADSTYLGFCHYGWGDYIWEGRRYDSLVFHKTNPGAMAYAWWPNFKTTAAEGLSGLIFGYLVSGRKDLLKVIESALKRDFSAYTPSSFEGKVIPMFEAFYRRDSLDGVPPSPISDLQVSNISGNRITLRWTAPGGNGSSGRAARYRIKMATAPIVDIPSRWNSATKTGWPDMNAPLPYTANALVAKAKMYIETKEISFWAAETIAAVVPIPSAAGTSEELVVANIDTAKTYYFAIVSYDSMGNVSAVSNSANSKTSAAEFQLSATKELKLCGVTPNPFNPATRLTYVLPSREKIEISIYALNGTLVNTLVNAVMPSGEHNAVWDGRDRNACAVASGIYYVRLVAGNKYLQRSMTLLR